MSIREVHIVVHGADGQPLPNATVAWYPREQVLTTGPDGAVSVLADSSITDVSIKVLHPAYQPYLQDPTKLLPPTNVNVGIGVPVGPGDVQFPPLVPVNSPLPPIPARAQMIAPKITFQGLTVQTQQYGVLPWFEPFVGSLAIQDRQAVYTAKRAAGDDCLNLALSYAYKEPGQPYLAIPGADFSQDIPSLKLLIREWLRAGGTSVLLMLAGDGEGAGPGYNDPVGQTYGYDWLMQNFLRIVQGLQADEDLTPFITFCPGYDGVFYGWTPLQVGAFGTLFRGLLPNGHLAIEHNTGHIPLGNGPSDYTPGGFMRDYDLILSEFDLNLQQDSCWQVVARLVHPYHRPPQQPVGDDPNPPYYLMPGTVRGPYGYCAFEWATYYWVRSEVSAALVQQGRNYLQSLGASCTG